jgi:hypothetical protein
MATVEVIGVRDLEIRRRILAVKNAKALQVGAVRFVPDTVVATWTRERILSSADRRRERWKMVAMAALGPRIVKGEVDEERRVEHRFGPDHAPVWMLSVAERYMPEDSF